MDAALTDSKCPGLIQCRCEVHQSAASMDTLHGTPRDGFTVLGLQPRRSVRGLLPAPLLPSKSPITLGSPSPNTRCPLPTLPTDCPLPEPTSHNIAQRFYYMYPAPLTINHSSPGPRLPKAPTAPPDPFTLARRIVGIEAALPPNPPFLPSRRPALAPLPRTRALNHSRLPQPLPLIGACDILCPQALVPTIIP